MTHPFQPAARLLVKAAPALLFSSLLYAQPPAAPEGDLPLDELRTFVEVMDRIKSVYVEPVDDKTLLENAIKGMLANLDPHSAYLNADAFQELQETTSGEFGGLGIEVGMEGEQLSVISPIDDTPAFAAGIEAGDLILKIDGQLTKGLSLMEAVQKMRGKAGTSITLTIGREDRAPFDVKLKRAIIKSRSVRGQLLDDDYGLLRISQFQSNTGKEVGKALQQLEKDNGKPLAGLIMDLRNNPGGVLQTAAEVSDHFLSQGKIVYTEGRIANSQMRFDANPQTSIRNSVPMVVLINGGSASASEIVAGALQDHKRAVIMGTNSFGKGSVQTILPINEERGVKLTTALYFTPSGRSIQAQGIEPDIRVERGKLSTQEQPQGIKEADLAGHLDNRQGGESRNKKQQAQTELLQGDNQLSQALSLLKGLNVLGRK
ncbi:MAG: S41 family peptidase [Gammaproteobacteria bacterium]|nr:S41 family peptidase [Gammaproteobacteria bacterium]